jgi:hypothetical protein
MKTTKKWNKLFLMGTLAIVLAFGLVVIGCDDGSDSGTPTVTAEELAAKLAVDLNTIKAGSATVEGATVKLADDVYLGSNFTVPAGVTLDVTAAGTALMLGDVTLTVNGVVNAGIDARYNVSQVRFEDHASDVTINGSGTINLKSKGRLLEVAGNHNVADHILTLDGVTLVGLGNNDTELVSVRSGGVGRTGTLVLKSGKITGNTHTGNGGLSGGGVKVREGGTFIMEGGEISGNTAQIINAGGGAGGVAVEDDATFTMSGGTISGNTAQSNNQGGHGGGVLVEGVATFTMSGGTISGNTASGEWSSGGGVSVHNNAIFTMEGGTISDNTAQSGKGATGGGVDIENAGATFTMTGGTISGNTAKSTIEYSGGGGVAVGDGATFTMEGGIISGNITINTNNNSGGGVKVENAQFTLKGGTIYGKSGNLPAGVSASLANSANGGASLAVYKGTAKWGTGGTYTGGEYQIGGGTILHIDPNNGGGTDDTLIAIP